MANGKQSKVENGDVYTPHALADYVASKVLSYLGSTATNGKPIADGKKLQGSLKVIDPACGDGELLRAVLRSYCGEISLGDNGKQAMPDKLMLCGVDIQAEALDRARSSLSLLCDERSARFDFKLARANAFKPRNRHNWKHGWAQLLEEFGAEAGFDLAILNPPWGTELPRIARPDEFELLEGQADSSDLFVEIAISIVREGGLIALIIPDSLFQSDKGGLRRMLMERTQLLYISRLGEGIFPKVNRGCSVVVARRDGRSDMTGKVRCFRLAPSSRRKIDANETTFSEAERASGHDVPLSRFNGNQEFLFDIDTREADVDTLRKLTTGDVTIGDFLSSSRGVELSKRGVVRHCPSCQKWQPQPSQRGASCSNCSAVLSEGEPLTATIIGTRRTPASVRLVVGEDVQRYHISGHRYLRLGFDGIKYKDEVNYLGPEILVRKTGISVSSTIDYGNAYTNQVVYILKPKSGAEPSVPLELFLAILNSRALNFLLMKRHGEIEWRSHPYITQRQVTRIALPKSRVLDAVTVYSDILNGVRSRLVDNEPLPRKLDAAVEGMVAFIFCLTMRDYDRILGFLQEVQQLAGVRKLSNLAAADVFSQRPD